MNPITGYNLWAKCHPRKAFSLFVACLAVLVLCMSSCGDARGLVPPVDAHTVGAQFSNIGEYFLWIGALALGLGVALWFIAEFAAETTFGLLAKFIPIRVAWSIGVAGTSIGSAYVWLGEHPYLFGAVCFLAAVAVAIHHWPDIRRWCNFRSAVNAILQKTI